MFPYWLQIQMNCVVHGHQKKTKMLSKFSNKNALISNNESTRFITVHVPDLYTYKFQLKEYILTIKKELRRFLCIKI